MDKAFDKAIAFILEGDTEELFYLRFLWFMCEKYHYTLEKCSDDYSKETIYIIKSSEACILVKCYVVGTIPNMPQAASWFKNLCSKRYKIPWTVCLCYDTDEYKEDISKFHQGDWEHLYKKIKTRDTVIDLAASADIEDIMLLDRQGICDYLGIDITQFPQTLKGAKGKKKMKALFRQFGQYYQEGTRANGLISSLDMQLLIDVAPIPLARLEQCFAIESKFLRQKT